MDKNNWERLHGKETGMFKHIRTGTIVWLGMNKYIYGYSPNSKRKFIIDDLQLNKMPHAEKIFGDKLNQEWLMGY